MHLRLIRTLTATLTLSVALFGALAFAQSADFDVASGKVVTSSRPAAESYPDGDGLKLTDGAYAFSWADMVGFEGTEPVTLTVDLGAVYDTIRAVNREVGELASGIFEALENHEEAQANIGGGKKKHEG